MTKAASRQKATNATNGKSATAATTNASVKPASAKATAAATQAAKASVTVAAAPTREVQSAPANKSTKNASAKANNKPAVAGAKPFALSDVTVASVQRARQIRKADFERFQKLHNFFVANDEATARTINGKANAKREQVDQWVGGAVNPQAMTCIQEVQEPQPALLALIIVSAAIAKYGENELTRRDKLGEMDSVIGARFDTSGLRSKQQMPQTVGASYVLRLVLGLAPEKRAACQTLRDILTHESNGRLVLTPTTQGLKPVFGTASTDSDDWDNLNQYKLKHMIKQAQSAKFQEAMQQLGGQHLYDAIRTQLKQAGGATMWDANKDKPALQAKNLRPRSNSADRKMSPRKQQPAKTNGAAAGAKSPERKHLPVEIKTAVQVVPPPAPVSVKATANAPTKKETAPKNKPQTKKPMPEKEVKTASPVKNASPVKKAAPGAIVSNASGRAVITAKACGAAK